MDLVQRAEVDVSGAAKSNPPGNPALDPFRLKGGAFTLLVLEPIDLRAPDFFRRLMDRLAQAPNFYRNAPIVVDLAGLAKFPPNQFCRAR